MTPRELRATRVALGIPGWVVCNRAKISRSRLSEIERGFVTPGAPELQRICSVLNDLAVAKSQLDEFARQVGWPCEQY